MKTSESIKNLAKALLVAQTQMGAAIKGSKNPFFKSSYADLPTVMEVVKGPLNDAGVLILQPPLHRDGKNFIETVLIHAESGEFAQSETEVICSKPNDPQAFGAAQTYARRFGLQAMGFIPAEDDDGNTAAGRNNKPTYTNPGKALTVQQVVEALKEGMTSELPNATLNPAETKPTTTPSASSTQTLEPLKKSGFRQKAKQTLTPVTTDTKSQIESDWN